MDDVPIQLSSKSYHVTCTVVNLYIDTHTMKNFDSVLLGSKFGPAIGFLGTASVQDIGKSLGH